MFQFADAVATVVVAVVAALGRSTRPVAVGGYPGRARGDGPSSGRGRLFLLLGGAEHGEERQGKREDGLGPGNSRC